MSSRGGTLRRPRNPRDDHSRERPNRRDGLIEQDRECGLGIFASACVNFKGLRIKHFGRRATRDTYCVVGVVEPLAANEDLGVSTRAAVCRYL